MSTLADDGYELRRQVVTAGTLAALREEVDRVAADACSACVRNLQRRSAVFAAFASDPVLALLIGDGMVAVRSILFDKTAEANWPVAWHRDLTICVERLDRKPIDGYGPWSQKDGDSHVQAPLDLLRRMITIRVHLDHADSENGALRVVPGSHQHGLEGGGDLCASLMDEEKVVSCDCAAGDALLMSPLILHSSPRSKNVSRRRVLHFEYAPADSLPPSLRWIETVAQ